jgi:hypothetical protein
VPIGDETSLTMDQVLARISDRRPDSASSEEIQAFIDRGRP